MLPILHYFWPAWSNNCFWKPIFDLFESGHFKYVLLHIILTFFLPSSRFSLDLGWHWHVKVFAVSFFTGWSGWWLCLIWKVLQAHNCQQTETNTHLSLKISILTHFSILNIIHRSTQFFSVKLWIFVGCSKELFHWDGSFEYPQLMF